jgi:hypothetical protein
MEIAPETPWQTAMMNCPRTVPFTIAPILARYRSVTSSPSGLSWRMSRCTASLLVSSEMNTYRKRIAAVIPPMSPPAAP